MGAAIALGYTSVDATGSSESKGEEGASETSAKLTDDARQQLETTLKSTNAVLTTLFEANLSFLDADCHAHACYSEGALFAAI